MNPDVAASVIRDLVSPRLAEIVEVIETDLSIGEDAQFSVCATTGEAVLARIKFIVAEEAVRRAKAAPSCSFLCEIANYAIAIKTVMASEAHNEALLKQIVDAAATEAHERMRSLAGVAPAGEA